MASVDDPYSTQLDLTLRTDAKLISDMVMPEVVTFTAALGDGAEVCYSTY